MFVRRAFTLIELLVVVAVIAVLVSLLLPAMTAARATARGAVCLANLKQVFTIARAYADDNRGLGPGLGAPYTALPHWALVVQQGAGGAGTSGKDLYSTRSALVCPSVRAAYALPMTRTYAINATGHAGLLGDPDNYDSPAPGRAVQVRVDLVQRPSGAPAFVDAAIVSFPDGAPPPTQCSSVLDFRQAEHVAARVSRFHGAARAGGAGAFQAAMYDGACHGFGDVPDSFATALP